MVRFLSDRRSKAFGFGALGAHLIQSAAARTLYCQPGVFPLGQLSIALATSNRFHQAMPRVVASARCSRAVRCLGQTQDVLREVAALGVSAPSAVAPSFYPLLAPTGIDPTNRCDANGYIGVRQRQSVANLRRTVCGNLIPPVPCIHSGFSIQCQVCQRGDGL